MVITFNCYLAQTMLGTKKTKSCQKKFFFLPLPKRSRMRSAQCLKNTERNRKKQINGPSILRGSRQVWLSVSISKIGDITQAR